MERSIGTYRAFYFILGIALALLTVFTENKLWLAAFFGIFFVIFTFWHFEYSLMGFLMLVPLVPHAMWNNTYLVLGMVFYYGVYLLKYVVAKKETVNLKKYGISFFIFMAATVLGVLFSYQKADSLRIFLFFAASFLAVFLIAGTAKDRKTLEKYILFLFLGVVLTSLYAIYQGITGVAVDTTLVDTTLNTDMPGRVYSTFGNPNNYAEYLIMFLPFCFVFAINRKSGLQKVFYLFLFLLPVIALVLTLSRSSWIAFALSVFVFLAFKNWKIIPVAVLAFFCMLPFMPQYIITRLLTIGNMQDTSNSYRLYIWEGVLKMLKYYWATGIGLGPEAFHEIYPTYANLLANVAPHSHMLYLEIWIETGIVGVLSFFGILLGNVKRAVAGIFQTTDSRMKNILLAGVCAVIGICFIGFAEYIFFYPRVMFYFFVMLAFIIAAVNINRKKAQQEA